MDPFVFLWRTFSKSCGKEAYDFEAERWVSLTEKPSVTFGAEACYMKGKLLTIGGVQSKQVDQYDLETNTWAQHFPRQISMRTANLYCMQDGAIRLSVVSLIMAVF